MFKTSLTVKNAINPTITFSAIKVRGVNAANTTMPIIIIAYIISTVIETKVSFATSSAFLLFKILSINIAKKDKGKVAINEKTVITVSALLTIFDNGRLNATIIPIKIGKIINVIISNQ